MKEGSHREYITPNQVRKVWVTAKVKGLSEEKLRDIVEQISRGRSVKALTKNQAKIVIDVLEGKAVLPVPRDSANVFALATIHQLDLIEDLTVEVGWTDKHVLDFIRRIFGRDSLRKLRRSEAGVVIKVLTAAIRKKKPEVA
jgi:hypothetical protein